MMNEREGEVAKDHFHDLPDELFLEITTHLDLRDLLKLRCVLPKWKQRLLQSCPHSSLCTLYITPSERSMKHLRQICRSNFFQQHITDVAFIPLVLRGEPHHPKESTLERYISKYEHLRGFESIAEGLANERGFQIYNDLFREHGPAVSDEASPDKKWEIYAFGLSQLPKLKKLKIVKCIDRVGLNASSFWYTDELAVSLIQGQPHPKSNDPAARVASQMVLQSNLEYDSVDPFMEITKTSIRPSQMEFGSGLIRQLDGSFLHRDKRALEHARAISSHLTSLTVSCEDSLSRYLPFPDTLWDAFLDGLQNLQFLQIYIGPDLDQQKWHYPAGTKVIYHFLKQKNLRNLRTFLLNGKPERPALIEEGALLPFLTRYSETLREVELNGVLLIDGDEKDVVIDTLKSGLAKIKEIGLNDFKMLVYRRDEQGAEQSWPYYADRQEWYCVYWDNKQWIHRSELEQLASDLGVMLRNGQWDFGEFVRRKREVRVDGLEFQRVVTVE